MSKRRDAWMAFIIYLLSGEIVFTFLTMSFPWLVWLILQPLIVVVAMFIVGLTFRSRSDDE